LIRKRAKRAIIVSQILRSLALAQDKRDPSAGSGQATTRGSPRMTINPTHYRIFTKIDKGALTNKARELLYFRGFFAAGGLYCFSQSRVEQVRIEAPWLRWFCIQ
jgi:hypothetical protein